METNTNLIKLILEAHNIIEKDIGNEKVKGETMVTVDKN